MTTTPRLKRAEARPLAYRVGAGMPLRFAVECEPCRSRWPAPTAAEATASAKAHNARWHPRA